MKAKIHQSNAHYQKLVESLFDELSATDDAVLNMSALDGGWSAIQVMHHLILTEELGLKYVRKKMSFSSKFEKTDIRSWFRTRALWFYLNTPFKFKAPEIVSEENLPGFTTLADTRTRWMNIRREWAEFLAQLPDDLLDKTVYRHPLAGRLGWLGMLDFYHYHFRRHRKQIRRTLGVKS